MAKTIEISIADFNGGIADDARKNTGNEFQISKHFDIFSNPKRLTPYRSLEADTETAVSDTEISTVFAISNVVLRYDDDTCCTNGGATTTTTIRLPTRTCPTAKM